MEIALLKRVNLGLETREFQCLDTRLNLGVD